MGVYFCWKKGCAWCLVFFIVNNRPVLGFPWGTNCALKKCKMPSLQRMSVKERRSPNLHLGAECCCAVAADETVGGGVVHHVRTGKQRVWTEAPPPPCQPTLHLTQVTSQGLHKPYTTHLLGHPLWLGHRVKLISLLASGTLRGKGVWGRCT